MSHPSDNAHEGAGVFYAALAYAMWGMMPLYWRLLGPVPALELTAHRVMWGALFVAIVVLIQGHFSRVLKALRQPRVFATLALTSVLIGVNWTIYVYCIETEQLVEGSLGYYIIPLVSFALGYFFFDERMTRLRLFGAALATVAVVLKTAALGHISWIAPSLALTFAFYGYFHKRVTLPVLDGLLVETSLLFPVAAGFILWLALHGKGFFPSRDFSFNAMLILGGPLTAIPLALFAAGARRVRLTTLGFLQYLSPSITLLLAVFLFGEAFTKVDLAAFGCVWAALLLVAMEGGSRTALSARLFARRPMRT